MASTSSNAADTAILKALLENLPFGVAITGGPPDFPVLRVSRTGLEMAGGPRDGLTGAAAGEHRLAWNIRHLDGRVPAREDMPLYRASRLGETVRNAEFRLLRPDGTELTVAVDATPIRNAAGEIVGALNCWRDVTESKAFEKARDESDRRFSRLFATMNEGLSICEAVRDPAGRVIDIRYLELNPTFERHTGRTREQLLGRLRSETLGFDERLLEQIQRVVDTGEAVRFEHHVVAWDRWYDASIYAWGPDLIANIFDDITERKRAEGDLKQAVAEREIARAELEAANRRTGEILASIEDDFYVLDRDWVFVYANRQFTSRVGKDPADFLGRRIWELFPKHIGTPFEENLRAAMEQRATRRFEISGKYTSAVYRMTAFPSADGITVLGTDVTDEKQREAALQAAKTKLEEADRQKNQFLAVLSHELRNPLTPIRNSLHLLDRVPADSASGRRAKAILDRQVDQLARLVDDLLDVTRILRGKVQLRIAPLELNELVRETLADHEAQAAAAGLTLAFVPAPGPVPIEGDRQRLAQAVSNLLHNAVKFTPAGGRITVTVAAFAGSATVAVADTGAGLAPSLLARLFEPFMQADETLDRSQGGLGLGLSLVKGFVEQHGGSIAAASPGLGRGSTFTLRLPMTSHAATAARSAEPQAEPAVTLRVLVVDDNADAAESLQSVLELHGYAVVTAGDGPAALAAMRTFRPQAVICDIGLPGMDGYAVARAVRADPELRQPFLVALSGYALPDDVERARAAGFDRHLAKPPQLDAVLGALRDAGNSSPRSLPQA